MPLNMDPVYHLDIRFVGKHWEPWCFDHDKSVMEVRFAYQAKHPVIGRAVRLLGLRGELLAQHPPVDKEGQDTFFKPPVDKSDGVK